jgi:P27 family predicted phage terminase small subunit
MRRKGPPPHPLGLRLLTGDKRPIPEGAPRPAARAPRRPRHVTGYARRWWEMTVPALASLGIVSEIDRTVLAIAASLYQEWRELGDAIADQGGPTYECRTIAGEVMRRPRPEVAMRARAQRELVSVLQDLGCTPASRSRVRALPPADDGDDPDGWKPGRKT